MYGITFFIFVNELPYVRVQIAAQQLQNCNFRKTLGQLELITTTSEIKKKIRFNTTIKCTVNTQTRAVYYYL